jgi:hypothetical protein
MTHAVELLWFSDCANHPAARAILEEVIADVAPGTPIRDIDATDPATAASLRFPGSPTIRVDGRDVDPGYADPGDYTPRCRRYRTSDGLRGLPARSWIEEALRRGHPSRHAAELTPPERDADPVKVSTGTDQGDSIVGAVVIGAACCAVPVLATAGIGILPVAGAVAGIAAITGAVAARRGRFGANSQRF